MENIIKGIQKLVDTDGPVLNKMEQAALLHRRHSAITFKILEVKPKSLKIQVRQEKNPAGNYFDAKRLIAIVHETFDKFFPGYKIHVHPQVYEISPVEQVTAKWIKDKMLTTGTSLKALAQETGINYTHLSALINETGDLSQVMKAMFYFYFLSKDQQ